MAQTTEPRDGRPRWAHRLGWLVLLWLAGVVATGLLAGALRLLMAWAGLQR
jgi:hypothetical protein